VRDGRLLRKLWVEACKDSINFRPVVNRCFKERFGVTADELVERGPRRFGEYVM